MMHISLTQTEKLLTGTYTFSQLGFSMMLTRLKGLYKKDPSQSTLVHCSDELNMFLEKFKGIMADDYSFITKL